MTGDSGEHPDDTPWGDPTRRLYLANERTFLAWWRTGVTSIAVGVGSAKLVPAIAKTEQWPYIVIGAGFALLGILCVGYAEHRRRAVERAAASRDWAPASTLVTTALSVAGAILGLALLAVLLATTK